MKVRIKKLNPAARMPTRGTSGAGGLDLYATKAMMIYQDVPAKIPTGIAIEIPAGHKDGESEVDDIMKAMFYLDREIDRVRKVEAPGGYSEVALWLGQHFALRNGYLALLFPTIIEQEEDKIKGMIECRKAVAKRYAELTRR